ncbi:MAG: hypothetical protein AAGI01_01275 [Myxococcota bacterium]
MKYRRQGKMFIALLLSTSLLYACGDESNADNNTTTIPTPDVDLGQGDSDDGVGGTDMQVEPPDEDADGIPDANDVCPRTAEDFDGVEDEDGCPDADVMDTDADGIADDLDACPTEAEDVDGVEDEDGCPDLDGLDTDADGIPDDVDACPMEAENINEFEDEDGCPDDPCTLDDDFDGIGNCDEELLGTDPNNTDTDGDFLSDFEELQAGTNPLSKDTDMDGLDDGRELFFGFDPKKKDTLGDGIEDGNRFIVNACETPESEPVDFYKSAPGDWNLALPAAFSTYTELHINGAANGQAAAVYDDSANEVAGFILSEDINAVDAVTRLLDHVHDLKTLGTVRQDLTEGEFDTHDRFKAAPGEYVVEVASKSSKAVRDDLLFRVAGFDQADVTNLPTSGGNLYEEFVFKITVLERGDRFMTTVSVAPTQRFDALDSVRFRMSDLTNTTNVSRAQDSTLLRCYPFPATTEIPAADFYWVLDQSGSMNNDFAKLKQFAQDFYDQLLNTSLDFRLGVTNMHAGFQGRLRHTVGWHTDLHTFTDEIQYYVVGCTDNFVGNCSGSVEYGLYAAREGITYMRGSASPQAVRMRPHAQLATIFMSDEEPQSYQSGQEPGGPVAGATQLRANYQAFFSNNPLAFSISGERGLCELGGEGYADIAFRTGGASASLCATDLSATIEQIINIVAGRASVFRLPQTPISSTLRVYVADEDGVHSRWVPRSRANGFDYFPQTNSIAFFGTFRPSTEQGDPVQVAVHYQAFRSRFKVPPSED